MRYTLRYTFRYTLGLLLLGNLIASFVIAGDLPDPKLTPGATLNISLSKLCEKGYVTKEHVRNVTEAEKKHVFEEYEVKNPAPGEFEIDHLISLEIGGSNDIHNLWPQSYITQPWNAHVKDALEDRLHALVCTSNPTLTLEQAQTMIRTDWIAAYKQIFHTDKPIQSGRVN